MPIALDAALAACVVAGALWTLWRKLRAPACQRCPAQPKPSQGDRVATRSLALGRRGEGSAVTRQR